MSQVGLISEKHPASLLHILVHVMERNADKHLNDKLNLSFNQFLIIMHVFNFSELNHQDIALKLGFSAAAISKQIKILEDDGLLKSNANPLNRREKQIQLTAKGEKVLDQASKLVTTISDEMFACLNKTELQSLELILRKLLITVHC